MPIKFPALPIFVLSAASLFLSPPKMLGAGNRTWAPHDVKQGNDDGGWTAHTALKQSLSYGILGRGTMGFGVAQMDNGEVILLGAWGPGTSKSGADTQRCVCAFSMDRGDHWTDLSVILDALGRPVMLTDLGKGNLIFQADPPHSGPRPQSIQYFSSDYGHTWPKHQELQRAANGGTIRGPGDEGVFGTEGNPLIDRDGDGRAVRIAELGFNFGHAKPNHSPISPCVQLLRWSRDGGRTWYDESEPKAWKYKVNYNGKEYDRGTGEGSLVRAANGWLVAALRTDLEPRFLWMPTGTDWLEGTGVSISKDDGVTWSPVKMLYEAGRHHADLRRLPNGDLLMTLIVRADIANGAAEKASHREGCEGILSHDNGLSWDTAHKYVIDSFYYYNPDQWYVGMCGHLCSCVLDTGEVLTIYSNYADRDIKVIRWRL